MASAGRVLLISKGTWASGTSYSPMDFVYYGGNSYVCKAAVSGSTTPGADTSHWQLMATGFDSDLITQTITNDSTKVPSSAALYAESQKERGNVAVIESSSTASRNYNAGDMLVMDGQLYEAAESIVINEPLVPNDNIVATTVASKINSLNGLFNFTDTGTVSTFTAGGGVSDLGTVVHPMRYAFNASKSAGKIYGFLRINNIEGSGGRITLNTNIDVAATGSAYVLHGIFGQYETSNDGWQPVTNPYITVAANGKVGLSFIASNVAKTYTCIALTMPACIYVFKDFGDPIDNE